MSERNFMEMLKARWAQGKFVCIGLDSDLGRIPESARRGSIDNTLYFFNTAIVDATHDLVCAFKPNVAFYEMHGSVGLSALKWTINYIHHVAPDVPIILDAKRADIGSTNTGYVAMAFDDLQADAITVHPYLGAEALEPFLARSDKGIFILCRTSNPGAGEFQDIHCARGSFQGPLYALVAHRVRCHWNKRSNCGLVVGATFPSELEKVRGIADDMPILIPGIGAQGGDVQATVSAGTDSQGEGMIVNSSRGIIFASSDPDFAEVARGEAGKLHCLITESLAEAPA